MTRWKWRWKKVNWKRKTGKVKVVSVEGWMKTIVAEVAGVAAARLHLHSSTSSTSHYLAWRTGHTLLLMLLWLLLPDEVLLSELFGLRVLIVRELWDW